MEENKDNQKTSARRLMIKDLEKIDFGSLVQIIGFIKERNEEDKFILDDHTGTIKISINNLKFPFKPGDLVNVFTKIKTTMDGEKIFEAIFFQDMSNLNFEHFKKLYDMKKDLI